jgi:hypothetical protein
MKTLFLFKILRGRGLGCEMCVFPCGGGFRVGVRYRKEFDFNKSKELLACVAC